MMPLLAKHWLVLSSLVAIAFALGCALVSVTGDVFIIDGNIHDLWLPVNAAYAMELGYGLHDTFHSPFGAIYFFLSSNAYRLISAFPDVFHVPAIHFLTSFQFLFVFIALFLIVRAMQEKRRRLPLWFLALMVLLVFQARTIDSFDTGPPSWYGIYNSQLWALFLLQAASNYLWKDQEWSDSAAFALAIVQGLFLLIAFNYKASFLPGAGLLCLLPYFYLGGLRRVAIYTAAGLFVVAVGTGLFALSGYSYSSYFADLATAATAKTSNDSDLDNRLLGVLIYLFLLQSIRHSSNAVSKQKGDAVSVRTYLVERILGQIKPSELGFDTIVAVGVAASQMGDFQQPVTPFFFLLAFIGFEPLKIVERDTEQRTSLSYYGAVLWVVAFCLISLSALYETAAKSRSSFWLPSKAEEIVFINYSKNPFAFRFNQVTSMEEFLDRGLLEKSDDWAERLVEASYSLYAENEWEPFGFPDLFGNQEYIEGLNLVVEWFDSRDLTNSGIAIESVGFANPWPFLTNNRFGRVTRHWTHIGTTLAPVDMDAYFRSLDGTDVLVLPLLGTDLDHVQFYLNCTFYLWNMRNEEPFIPQEIIGTYLIMVREGGNLQPWTNLTLDLPESKVASRCDQLYRHL